MISGDLSGGETVPLHEGINKIFTFLDYFVVQPLQIIGQIDIPYFANIANLFGFVGGMIDLIMECDNYLMWILGALVSLLFIAVGMFLGFALVPILAALAVRQVIIWLASITLSMVVSEVSSDALSGVRKLC